MESREGQMASGAQLMAQALKKEGVDALFCVPGNPLELLLPSLYEAGIKVIAMRHEQAAAFAAQAYSFMSDTMGVAITVHGVGMTNAITSLVNARDNCWPFLLISGSVPRRRWGKGDFQELRQVEIARPITKFAESIDRVERVPEHVSLAFRYALSGRPGPVYIDFPADVIRGTVDASRPRFYDRRYRAEARPAGDPRYVRKAAELLRHAQSPLIVVGKGVRWAQAYQELITLANRNLPCILQPMARGMIPDEHPMCFADARSYALRNADVILCVGARFNWMLRMGIPQAVNPEAKVIQIDIEAEEIGSNRAIDVGIVGDAKLVLQQLIGELGDDGFRFSTPQWVQALGAERERNIERIRPLFDSDEVPIKPHRFYRDLEAVKDRDAIVTVDGEIVMQVSRMINMHHTPGHRLDAGTQGCIGAGVPFAIGAKVAKPNTQVISVSGDSSFGFNCMDMETAVRNDIPVVFVVLNNDGIGGSASREGADAITTYIPGIQYQKIMDAFGGHTEYVDHPDQIRPALERAFASGKAACINVAIDPAQGAIPGQATRYL